MEYYNYYYGMRHSSCRNKLFLDPLQPGEKFGLRFWKDESEYPWEIGYSLRITQGSDKRHVIEKFIHEYVELLSVSSLYLQEGEVDGFAGYVLKISLLFNESSKPEIKHFYCNRSVDNSVAIKCTVQDGKKIIELIVNDRNVGIFHCNENDTSTYAVIHHSSRSADVLISRLSGLPSMRELCRQQILKCMDKDLLKNKKCNVMTQLPIPKVLQTYLKQGVDEFLRPEKLVFVDQVNGSYCMATCKTYENKDGKYGPSTGHYGIITF